MTSKRATRLDDVSQAYVILEEPSARTVAIGWEGCH